MQILGLGRHQLLENSGFNVNVVEHPYFPQNCIVLPKYFEYCNIQWQIPLDFSGFSLLSPPPPLRIISASIPCLAAIMTWMLPQSRPRRCAQSSGNLLTVVSPESHSITLIPPPNLQRIPVIHGAYCHRFPCSAAVTTWALP